MLLFSLPREPALRRVLTAPPDEEREHSAQSSASLSPWCCIPCCIAFLLYIPGYMPATDTLRIDVSNVDVLGND